MLPWRRKATQWPHQRGTAEDGKERKEIAMLLTIFVILLVLWLLGFFAFHIAGGLIHILLVIAVISLVVHLFRGRNTA
jgi:hypothetical protein